MNHPGTFNPNLCLYAKMQEWVQLQARTGHKGAAGTCPVGSLKNLTLVLWEIFNRATKLGRPRAMILLGGPQRTSSDLTAPLPPLTPVEEVHTHTIYCSGKSNRWCTETVSRHRNKRPALHMYAHQNKI
jgi:hypothetical protein